MLAWGIAVVLCLALVCQGAFLRQKIHALDTCQTRLSQALEETAQTLEAQKALAAQQAETAQALRLSLAEKEAMLTELSAPKPRLYLPDEEEPQMDTPREQIVYYNENTGIYHADRFCAPYQAIETPLSQIPSHARPCKKCAEWMFSPPPPASQPLPEAESQLSLFDSPAPQ